MAQITIVGPPNCTLLVNDKTIKLGANGEGIFDTDMVLKSENTGVYEFDRELDNLLNVHQKLALYELFISNSRVGVQELQGVLEVGKSIVDSIKILGMKHRVIEKIDTQLRASTEKKIALRKVVQTLETMNNVKVEDEPETFKAEVTEEVEVKEEKTWSKKSMSIPRKKKGEQ